MQVESQIDRLTNAGIGIVVVTQSKVEVLARYLERTPKNYPFVTDPDRLAYKAFGLERTPWWSFFRPGELWRYLRARIRGTRIQMPYAGEDVQQLGGDFLLDRAGRITFSYPSRLPTDRPSIESILAAADR